MLEIPWFNSDSNLFQFDSTEIATCDTPLTFASNDETESVVMCCCNTL